MGNRKTNSLCRFRERGEEPTVERVVKMYLSVTGTQHEFLRREAARVSFVLGERVTLPSLLRALIQREMDRLEQKDMLDA